MLPAATWSSLLMPTASPLQLPSAPEPRALLHRCLLCRVTPPVSPTELRPFLSQSPASLRRSRLLLLSTMTPSLLPALLPWTSEWTLAAAPLESRETG